jgi:hypothetical protein
MTSNAITDTHYPYQLLIFSITCHSLSLTRPELRTLAKVDLAMRLHDSWRVLRPGHWLCEMSFLLPFLTNALLVSRYAIMLNF